MKVSVLKGLILDSCSFRTSLAFSINIMQTVDTSLKANLFKHQKKYVYKDFIDLLNIQLNHWLNISLNYWFARV